MNEEELMEPTPPETPPAPAADADAQAELDALRAWKAARLEADALQSHRDAVARLLREDGALSALSVAAFGSDLFSLASK